MNEMIAVRGLRKLYGNKVAVDGIDFEVHRGEIVGLLGPNGAGKTTTLEILSALRPATSGSVLVAGADPAKDPGAVRSRLGAVLQAAALDPVMTALEVLTLQGRLRGLRSGEARERASVALEQAGLADCGADRIGTLSGGQRRRVDLAVAVAGNPDVLLLDEPTAGLDPVSRLALWDHLRTLAARGTAILLSTQDLNEAERLAGRLVVLRAGRVVASATSARLKSDVGTRSLVLALGAHDHRDQALDVAARIGMSAVAGDQDGQVRVRLGDDDQHVGQCLAALATSGIEVTHLTLDEPTLDDVFVRLTN